MSKKALENQLNAAKKQLEAKEEEIKSLKKEGGGALTGRENGDLQSLVTGLESQIA